MSREIKEGSSTALAQPLVMLSLPDDTRQRTRSKFVLALDTKYRSTKGFGRSRRGLGKFCMLHCEAAFHVFAPKLRKAQQDGSISVNIVGWNWKSRLKLVWG